MREGHKKRARTKATKGATATGGEELGTLRTPSVHAVQAKRGEGEKPCMHTYTRQLYNLCTHHARTCTHTTHNCACTHKRNARTKALTCRLYRN